MSQSKLLLKRSAMEAGLDEQHAVLELSRPRNYGDFLWHSSGRLRGREEEGEEGLNNNSNPSDEAAVSQIKKESGTVEPASTTSGASTNNVPSLQITKRSATTKSLVVKQRFFMEQFAASPFFVKVHQTADVARWNAGIQQTSNANGKVDKNYKIRTGYKEPEDLVLDAMGSKLANDERYVPAELGPNRHIVDQTIAKLRNKKRNRAATGAAGSAKLQNQVKLEDLERRERKGGAVDDEENEAKGDGTGEEKDKEGSNNEDDDLGEFLDAEDAMEEEGDDYMQDYYASEDEDDDDGGGDDGEPVF